MSKQCRKLKVYYGHHSSYKRYPVIRLGGDYLAKAGFKVGDEVSVRLEENRIIIEKVVQSTPKNA